MSGSGSIVLDTGFGLKVTVLAVFGRISGEAEMVCSKGDVSVVEDMLGKSSFRSVRRARGVTENAQGSNDVLLRCH